MRKSWRLKPMRKPEQPEDESCCAGGCCPCVFDSYLKECARWKLYQQFLKEEAAAGRGPAEERIGPQQPEEQKEESSLDRPNLNSPN
jgi:hypothetical protein